MWRGFCTSSRKVSLRIELIFLCSISPPPWLKIDQLPDVTRLIFGIESLHAQPMKTMMRIPAQKVRERVHRMEGESDTAATGWQRILPIPS